MSPRETDYWSNRQLAIASTFFVFGGLLGALTNWWIAAAVGFGGLTSAMWHIWTTSTSHGRER